MTSPRLVERLRERAQMHPSRVVLPEGDDPRVLAAARQVHDAGIARVTLVGTPDALRHSAIEVGVTLEGLDCVDPVTDPRRPALVERYLAARHLTSDARDAAAVTLTDPLWFGSMLVESGAADGLVAGARTTTGATIEPALRLRRMVPGMPPISSCFLMELPSGRLADSIGDVLVFADCALNPTPSAALLARIAMAAADAARHLAGLEPRVALLASSTKGSATSDRIEVVRSALVELARRAPELVVDGELQADAALIASVGASKAPGSPVAGRANVLVFPDLESGNIAYKLVERLAGARAVGPIFSGLSWPVNDLSRGCSVDDVIDVVAVTVVQAQAQAEARSQG